MKKSIVEMIRGFIRQIRMNRRWRNAVTCMAALVVFVTTYVLILPAITMGRPHPRLSADMVSAWAGDPLSVTVSAESPAGSGEKVVVLTAEAVDAGLSEEYEFDSEGVTVIQDSMGQEIRLHRTGREGNEDQVDYWFVLAAGQQTEFTLALQDEIDVHDIMASVVNVKNIRTEKDADIASASDAEKAAGAATASDAVKVAAAATASDAVKETVVVKASSSVASKATSANAEEEDEDGLLLDGVILNDLDISDLDEATEVTASLKLLAGMGDDLEEAVRDAERSAEKRGDAIMEFRWRMIVRATEELSWEDDGVSVRMYFNADAAIPEGASLYVAEIPQDSGEYQAYLESAKGAVGTDAGPAQELGVKYARFFDIRILDADGNEVEPESQVVVKIDYDEAESISEDTGVQMVHFPKEGGTELVDAVVDGGSEELNGVVFNASGFSVYGIVGTGSLVTTFLSTDGNTYEVKVTCDTDAIPSGAELVVSEVEEGSEKYNDYFEGAVQTLSVRAGSIAYRKLLDISIVKDGEDVTPQIPVSVQIRLLDKQESPEKTTLNVIHYEGEAETPTVVEGSEKEDGTVEFEAEGFSVYGVFYTVDLYYEVNGKNFEYSILGGDAISFRELVRELHILDGEEEGTVPATASDAETSEATDKEIEAFVRDIRNVEFSDESLIKVIPVSGSATAAQLKQEYDLAPVYSSDFTTEDIAKLDEKSFTGPDWVLFSLKAFDTEEMLSITMENGDVFTVRVTDAQKVPDPSKENFDKEKSYLICYEQDGVYYLLKNDGGVDSTYTPAQFDDLNSTFCWSFHYVFEEKHVEENMNYIYYLIRPIDQKSLTLALNEGGKNLIQPNNNNIALIAAEGGGFHLVGYNDVKLSFADGAFCSAQLPREDKGIVVHIYEMSQAPVYDYTVRSFDEQKGTVTVAGGTQKEETDESGNTTHYYAASSDHERNNAGVITATPVAHANPELGPGDSGYGENKWEFDHWEQDGVSLDRTKYPATIEAGKLPIPFNESKLVAYFKQNEHYVVPNSEKEPTTFDDMTHWLDDLEQQRVPLDETATGKTAEVYDYENRIYRVDITSKANFRTFHGNIDMAFCMDVSNSMKFPSKLEETSYDLPIYRINDNRWNQAWLDQSRGWDDPYYLIADEANTATVFKIYYKDGNWKAIDASRDSESDKSFKIGDRFATTWCNGCDDWNKDGTLHPFGYYDNTDSTYTIYEAGDEGRDRFYYLNQSFGGAVLDLRRIKEILSVANDPYPDVDVAFNTFNKNLGKNNRQDFKDVEDTPTEISLQADASGGTRPDQAFINAQSFHWDGDSRYLILITDGAPQGKRDDEPKDITFNDISQKVKNEAQKLKHDKNVKFITIGLSLDKVPHGKGLLYDLADTDKKGEKMFFLAESASDLSNILREVIKTVMEDAIVLADVTDTVGEAFYPVDKNTGLPLQPGDKITIEGGKAKSENEAAGIVQNDGITIKWLDQAIDPSIGWHGAVYVKAKEDLIGGNAVKTNGSAKITAKAFKTGDVVKPFTETADIIQRRLKTKEIEFQTPRVNVNELDFSTDSTEWTVYVGKEVNPKEQLRKLYEELNVFEVVNEDEDGTLHYQLVPDSIEDDRTDVTGTAKKIKLSEIILGQIQEVPALKDKYVKDSKLDWDAFLQDIMTPNGVTVPYHAYGIEGEDSGIFFKVTREVPAGVPVSQHATTVVNGADNTPAEKYVLTVQFNPDYVHVLPPGQGGSIGTETEYNTGTFGTMYQGHAAGRETATETHKINVYAEPLDVLKKDDFDDVVKDAEFKLYREAADGETGVALSSYDPSLTYGKGYYCISTAKTGADGIAHLAQVSPGQGAQNLLALLEEGKTYYLIETSVPSGYRKDEKVRTVRVEAYPDTYTDMEQEPKDASEVFEDAQTQKIAFNWKEGVRLWIKELGAEGDEQAVLIADPATHKEKILKDDTGSRRYYVLKSDDPIVFQTGIVNKLLKNIAILKTGGDGRTGLRGAVFQLYTVSDDGRSEALAKDIDGLGKVIKTIDGKEVTFESAFESDGSKHLLAGLVKGKYRLKEVFVPEGYIIDLPNIDFEVKKDSVVWTTGDSGKVIPSDNTLEVTIINTPGAALPNSGGPGTLLYTLGGMLLVLASAVMYGFRMRLRRKEVNY